MVKQLKIALFLLVLLAGTGWAKEKPLVAVLPFSVHSAENIDYVQQGIWDMLSSRIAVSTKIEVATKEILLANLPEAGKKDLALADVYGLGKKISADFVIWGSITKIGDNVSIDGKLVDISAYKSPVGIFAQSQGLDEIIPKINDFAQRISTYIASGGTESIALPALTSSPTLPAPSTATPLLRAPEQPSPQAARERQLIAGLRSGKTGTMTAIPVNSDYINTPQAGNTRGFWMSQEFGTEFKGMAIGDVNADGLNEIVLIDGSNIYIYQSKGGALTPIQPQPPAGAKSNNYLAVDIADINNNGIKEIIVTSMVGDSLNSFVLEWKEGKFVPVATGLPWFLRVIQDSAEEPILLGQVKDRDKPFNAPITEIVWDGTAFREGKKMKIPEGLSVYGLTLSALDNRGTEKVIALGASDKLTIYDRTDKPLERIHVLGGGGEVVWKSDDDFGGSNNGFFPYGGRIEDEDGQRVVAFINPRILTYGTSKAGKKEFVLVKSSSATGTAFKNFRFFTSSEIIDMEWDGLGMAENWRTKKINGYVADYQIKDIDNDGQNELVLAVVLSAGPVSKQKSTIVSYKLMPQEIAAPAK